MVNSPLWPLHDLVLHTPRLSLRPVRDVDLPGLVDAATAGIFDDDTAEYAFPWQQGTWEEVRTRVVQHQWSLRAALTPASWTVQFAVRAGAEPLGVQDLAAQHFDTTQSVRTASWLTRKAHGQGIGTEMRQAVLLFAFDYLGARVAHSSYAANNGRSAGVCARLGYKRNGVDAVAMHGKRVEEVRVLLERSDFIRPGWNLEVEGWNDAVRAQLVATTTRE